MECGAEKGARLSNIYLSKSRKKNRIIRPQTPRRASRGPPPSGSPSARPVSAAAGRRGARRRTYRRMGRTHSSGTRTSAGTHRSRLAPTRSRNHTTGSATVYQRATPSSLCLSSLAFIISSLCPSTQRSPAWATRSRSSPYPRPRLRLSARAAEACARARTPHSHKITTTRRHDDMANTQHAAAQTTTTTAHCTRSESARAQSRSAQAPPPATTRQRARAEHAYPYPYKSHARRPVGRRRWTNKPGSAAAAEWSSAAL